MNTSDWQTHENLALLAYVTKVGSDKWEEDTEDYVLRKMHSDLKRPADWYSPSNCLKQFEKLSNEFSKLHCSNEKEDQVDIDQLFDYHKEKRKKFLLEAMRASQEKYKKEMILKQKILTNTLTDEERKTLRAERLRDLGPCIKEDDKTDATVDEDDYETNTEPSSPYDQETIDKVTQQDIVDDNRIDEENKETVEVEKMEVEENTTEKSTDQIKEETNKLEDNNKEVLPTSSPLPDETANNNDVTIEDECVASPCNDSQDIHDPLTDNEMSDDKLITDENKDEQTTAIVTSSPPRIVKLCEAYSSDSETEEEKKENTEITSIPITSLVDSTADSCMIVAGRERIIEDEKDEKENVEMVTENLQDDDEKITPVLDHHEIKYAEEAKEKEEKTTSKQDKEETKEKMDEEIIIKKVESKTSNKIGDDDEDNDDIKQEMNVIDVTGMMMTSQDDITSSVTSVADDCDDDDVTQPNTPQSSSEHLLDKDSEEMKLENISRSSRKKRMKSKRSGRQRKTTVSSQHSQPPSATESNPQSEDEDKARKMWKNNTLALLKQISGLGCADIFSMPVKDKNAPNYSRVIHQPMDLQTIKKKLETSQITTSESFKTSLLMMIQNAIMYNRFGDAVYKKALELYEEINPVVQPQNKNQDNNDATILNTKRTKRAAAKQGEIKMKRKQLD